MPDGLLSSRFVRRGPTLGRPTRTALGLLPVHRGYVTLTPRLREGRLIEQPVHLSPARRFSAVGDGQLSIDVGQVELDRLRRNPEKCGELTVRVSLSDHSKDLDLAGRQVAEVQAGPRAC